MFTKILKVLLWVLGVGIVTALFVLCFVVLSDAQSAGPISITSTQCAQIDTGQAGVAFIQITGTWSGTLQPKGAIAGQSAFNLQMTPSTSGTAQSTITANGGYSTSVAGYSLFEVCGNTVSSGTAKVYLQLGRNTRRSN